MANCPELLTSCPVPQEGSQLIDAVDYIGEAATSGAEHVGPVPSLDFEKWESTALNCLASVQACRRRFPCAVQRGATQCAQRDRDEANPTGATPRSTAYRLVSLVYLWLFIRGVSWLEMLR